MAGADNPPQTGGLHESFGDLTAIFLALSQLDQCEAIIAQTKARLHDKTFLADIAEQFGLALGASTGLRNADNDLTLSDAGTEVHAISQVFTGAIYDILADLFAFERNPALFDDAWSCTSVGAYLRGLVLRALVAAPDIGATYADVVNQMLRLTAEDGKPVEYRNSIRNRFTAARSGRVAGAADRGPCRPAAAARRAGPARRGAGPARLLRHHEPGRVLQYRPHARRRSAGAGALVRRARPQRPGRAAAGAARRRWPDGERLAPTARRARGGASMKISPPAAAASAAAPSTTNSTPASSTRARRSKRCCSQLDFFGAAPPAAAGADIGRWDITVADGAREHTVTFAEDGSAGSAPWQSLVSQLRTLA